MLDVWFQHPSFKELLVNEWKILVGKPFQLKLRALKKPILQWSKKIFGDVDRKIEKLESQMLELQRVSEVRDPGIWS